MLRDLPAAALLAAAAVTGGDVTVTGLEAGSHQPDRRFPGVLERFGARVEAVAGGTRVRGGDLVGCSFHLGDAPDLAPEAERLASMLSRSDGRHGAV